MNYMKKSKTSQLSGVQILALGFAIVILVGAIILTLPISSKSGNFTNFLCEFLKNFREYYYEGGTNITLKVII